MIIPNGTIEVKIKTGGGIDPKKGYPIEVVVDWARPIPCQFQANKYDNTGRVNGEAFTIASYEVLIDGVQFEHEQIRLKTESGKTLGEFSVIEVEPLTAVEQTKIWV